MKKFTLMELLVVISITGILTSILLPSLSKARKKVQQAACMNNQHQVSLAMISYISENSEYAPHDDSNLGGTYWFKDLITHGMLPETVTSGGYYAYLQCPNAMQLVNTGSSTVAANSKLIQKNKVNHKTSALASPTETMMLIDSYNRWSAAWPGYLNMAKLITDGEPGIIARHLGKANVTYLDGSGRSQSAAYLMSKSSGEDTFWHIEK